MWSPLFTIIHLLYNSPILSGMYTANGKAFVPKEWKVFTFTSQNVCMLTPKLDFEMNEGHFTHELEP
jgi:hypothetical protein